MFFRSPGAVFWTVAFPVLLILLFGAIFSGSGTTTYNLYVQDMDDTQASHEFIQALTDDQGAQHHRCRSERLCDQYIKDHSIASFLIIPKDFQNAFAPEPYRQNVTIELRLDNSSSSSARRGHGGHGRSPRATTSTWPMAPWW